MSTAIVVAGVVCLALGATTATITHRRMGPSWPAWRMALALAPHGVVVGGGAALVRGDDLVRMMLVGAVVVPLVGIAGARWQTRRGAERAR